MTPRGLPWAARTVLRLTLPKDWRDDIVRDLGEAYEQRCARGRHWVARLWLAWQVLVFPFRFLVEGLRVRIVRSAARSPRGPRARRGDGMIRTVLRDIRYAGRGLLKTPGQTVAAILALGLGSGITTADFSLL